MPTLRDALKADLKALGITQKEFAARLPASQQAINQWLLRNAIPGGRQSDIINILGPDSQVAAGIAIGFTPIDAPRAESPRADYHRPASSREFRSRVEDQRRSREDMRDVIRAALPGAELHQFMQVGPTRRHFDYVSNTLVANIVAPPTVETSDGRPVLIMNRFTHSLLDLAVARKNDSSNRNYMLIAVVDDPNAGRAIQQLVWDASQFDVSVFPAHSFTDAGILIVDTELDASRFEEDEFNPPPQADEEGN